MNEQDDSPAKSPHPAPKGSGSVAHDIIEDFLTQLAAQTEYKEISESLRTAVFGDKKVNEATLRKAILDEDA